MSIDQIVGALNRASKDLSLPFFKCKPEEIVFRIRKFPSVWIGRPELIAEQGREEGIKIYAVEVNFITLEDKRGNEVKELEKISLRYLTTLRNDGCIREVEVVASKVCDGLYTNKGDVSLEYKIKITVNF